MSLIYWDTMLFVYWLEENPTYIDTIHRLLRGMAARRDDLCTSAFTLGEVLVGPRKTGDVEGVNRVREAMRPPRVRILPYTHETAERYATIRATLKVSAPDAIHLASAASADVDLFLTHDRQLQGKVVPGIQFVAGLDTNLFDSA